MRSVLLSEQSRVEPGRLQVAADAQGAHPEDEGQSGSQRHLPALVVLVPRQHGHSRRVPGTQLACITLESYSPPWCGSQCCGICTHFESAREARASP